MSLFGSVYDESSEDGENPDDAGISEKDFGISENDFGISENDAGATAQPADGPVAASPDDELPEIEIDAPEMRLEDFAAEMFTDSAPPDSAPPDSAPSFGGADSMSAPSDVPETTIASDAGPSAPRVPTPATSVASAASDLADLAKSPVATLAPPAAAEHDETETDDDAADRFGASEANDPASDDEAEFAEPLLIDDLLPSAKPAGGRSLPSVSFSDGIPLKLIVVLFVAAIVGFVGVRLLTGGSDEATGSSNAAASQPGPSAGIGSPAEALDRVQLVGAEADLRNATVAAAAEYANTGTFGLSAADWGEVLPEITVQDGTGTAPSQGTLSVISNAGAVCFETVLQNGTTVAAGVTATTRGFRQSPGGGSICTTDPVAIEGWSPSL